MKEIKKIKARTCHWCRGCGKNLYSGDLYYKFWFGAKCVNCIENPKPIEYVKRPIGSTDDEPF